MKNRASWRVGAVAVLVAISMPVSARAADATAEELYQQGRLAADQKNWTLACQKFGESQAREAAPGTLLNLANCEENLGHLRDALGHFRTASQLFQAGDERATYAQQRARGVERRMPKLVARLDPGASSDATVQLDGAPMPSTALSKPQSLDPGEHQLLVTAPGHTSVTSRLRLAEGESREIELTVGPAVVPGQNPASTVIDLASPSPSPAMRGAEPPPDSSSPFKTAGYIAFGGAAIGVTLGIVGGLLTIGAKNTVDQQCRPGCTQTGLNAESSGKMWSTVSTVGFAVGGVALATGVTVLLVKPTSASAVVARPSMGGAEVGWATSF